ncbi:hypothetical protein DI53_3720 [Sphingobacterium deserti]|uniref:RagB/SusD domain-containing protein n=2 Tax=Sphingobacterium deserti TaxID=1229276 RepID=A0A0B8T626_9SPHI|nr:hypothetical protein DI53_3720 [Sphingobacterium deserti]
MLIVCMSCSNDFLELKPDKKLIIPSKLEDYQALLDEADLMNRMTAWIEEAQADDYYISTAGWQAISWSSVDQNAYIWATDIYGGTISTIEWNRPYSVIYRANVVLDGMEQVDRQTNPAQYDDIVAQALFFRAWHTFRQALVFAPAYEFNKDNQLVLGIPLRLHASLNEVTVRASLEETFQQVLSDLQRAEGLFRSVESEFKTRPSQISCWALLSRVYLYMQNYEKAEHYAALALDNFSNDLIDLSTWNLSPSFPFTRFNQEVLFHCAAGTPTAMNASRLTVDSILYASYAQEDYRRQAFFRQVSGRPGFRGSYDGSAIFFNGLTIAECYLTVAECLVRKGDAQSGLSLLSTLLQHRIANFTPLRINESEDPLKVVLEERRKEMLFKGVRWLDLKRLNLDPRTAVTIYREIGGQRYSLNPNSKNYTLPLPPEVIKMSGVEQNQRD